MNMKKEKKRQRRCLELGRTILVNVTGPMLIQFSVKSAQ